jgi:chromate transporter
MTGTDGDKTNPMDGLPPDSAAEPGRASAVPFTTALLYWLRLGLVSFGGPAGQIALMQADLVDRHRWIDQRRFLHALNFCMLLPGPEAMQLATYIGWRLHGIRGGLAAGVLFVLPGAAVLLVLSWIAAAHGNVGLVEAVFAGIQPVVVAIVAHAVHRIGKRTLGDPLSIALAIGAFLALRALGVPFPAIVLAAALIGVTASLLGWRCSAAQLPGAARVAAGPAPGLGRLARVTLVFAALWIVPVALALVLLGAGPWGDIVQLFTTAAFVTFGGAYAVLPYIAQAAVDGYGWLSPTDMTRALALAESTPGPLILVTQFVGFFAGWNDPGALPPLAGGVAGSALTLYVTFLPCFFFIFAGAPYIERLAASPSAIAALAAVTAAVVGVILDLGVFLGEAVLLPGGRLDWMALGIAAVALVLLEKFRLAVQWTVLAGGLYGILTWSVSASL